MICSKQEKDVIGSTITRQVGDAYFEYKGDGGAAPVIFGEKGDEPLPGVTTLESWLNIILMCWVPIAIRIKLLFITELQTANVTQSQPLRRLVRKRLCRRVNIYQSTSTRP
ncbi:MAG: hypothetical protein WC868_09885 [Bacteroidales bacterium]